MSANGDGNVILTDEYAAGVVEALPTGTRHEHFRPGVRGAVALHGFGAMEVAADEAGRQAEVAAGFNEEVGEVLGFFLVLQLLKGPR